MVGGAGGFSLASRLIVLVEEAGGVGRLTVGPALQREQKLSFPCLLLALLLQAGTLSGNPLAMVAGIKTLEILGRPGAYEHLDRITARLIAGILAAAKETGHAMCGGSISGMFGFFFCEGPVTCFEDAKAAGAG